MLCLQSMALCRLRTSKYYMEKLLYPVNLAMLPFPTPTRRPSPHNLANSSLMISTTLGSVPSSSDSTTFLKRIFCSFTLSFSLSIADAAMRHLSARRYFSVWCVSNRTQSLARSIKLGGLTSTNQYLKTQNLRLNILGTEL